MIKRFFYGNNILLDPAPAPQGDPGGGGGGGTPMISQAEAMKLVEKARQDEKTKLFGQIEALTTDKTKLTEQVGTLTQQVADLTTKVTTLSGQLEAVEAAKNGGQVVDVKKLVEEVAEKTRKEVSADFQTKLDALDTEVKTTKQSHRKLTLEQYKAKAIADAGGENALIIQLVSGDSEEAIAASIANSKQVFEQTKSRITGGAIPNTTTTPPPAAPPVLPGTVPNPPAGGAPGAPGVPEVRNMSMKDFGAKRQDLKAAAAARYKQQVTA